MYTLNYTARELEHYCEDIVFTVDGDKFYYTGERQLAFDNNYNLVYVEFDYAMDEDYYEYDLTSGRVYNEDGKEIGEVIDGEYIPYNTITVLSSEPAALELTAVYEYASVDVVAIPAYAVDKVIAEYNLRSLSLRRHYKSKPASPKRKRGAKTGQTHVNQGSRVMHSHVVKPIKILGFNPDVYTDMTTDELAFFDDS